MSRLCKQQKPGASPGWRRLPAVCLLLTALPLRAATTNDVAEEVRLLREENGVLKKTVKQQGEQLDLLNRKVSNLEATQAGEGGAGQPAKETFPGFNRVILGGEGGVGYAITGPEGAAPNGKFRVDDARLFIEAPLWTDIYFYGEVVLATASQQSYDSSVELGEIYLEFENVSKLWHQDNQLNARLGQMYIPFGEEYLVRNAIDNPLITHSIVDFWGVAPGVELYGDLGKFTYVVAVQNGANGGNGAGGDKSVAARVGFDPTDRWHFSVSAMRSGDVKADDLTAMWFGNGFFQSIGSMNTTLFHAEAVEGDVARRWHSGHVAASGGWAHYADNDPAGNNARDVYYYSVEAVQKLPKKFFAAARWSQVFCDHGIPIVGLGENGDYSTSLTTDLWRLSLGLGYQFSDKIVLKAEYAFERGRETSGDRRQNEDFFGTEAAFKF
jgi:hypothetical protein